MLEEIPAPRDPLGVPRPHRCGRSSGGDGRGGAAPRHAAALVAGRCGGARPSGSAPRPRLGRPPAVVTYGTRAANPRPGRRGGGRPRPRGPRAGVVEPEMGESARLAPSTSGGWPCSTLVVAGGGRELEAAAGGRRALGEGDPALASVSAASAPAGTWDGTTSPCGELQDHLARSRDPGQPPAARGEALTQAAGMAVKTSRFGDAMGLAGEARDEARARRRRRDLDARPDLHGDGRERARRRGRAPAPRPCPPRGRARRPARAGATRRSR